MNHIPQLLENIDDLTRRKLELSFMQNIPDMCQYAKSWNNLAVDFEAAGMLSNAEYCRSRGKHYAELAGGEYLRLIEQPLAELIQVAEVL
jgi:hypothetical protein